MENLIKKYLILWLFVIFIFSTLYFTASTYIHEQGHIIRAENHNINLSLNKFNPYPQLDFLAQSGRAGPKTIQDCKAFNQLNFASRRDITTGGVLFEAVLCLIFNMLTLSLLFFKKISTNIYLKILIILICICSITLYSTSFYMNLLSNKPLVDGNVFWLKCA